MLLGKLSEQTEEMKSVHREQLAQVQAQLAESSESLHQIRAENDALNLQIQRLLVEHPQHLEQIRAEHEEALLEAARQAVAPVNKELEALRKEREDYLVLKNKYQELEALIGPFRVIRLFHFSYLFSFWWLWSENFSIFNFLFGRYSIPFGLITLLKNQI